MNVLNENYLCTKIKKQKPIIAGLDASVYKLAGKYKRRASVLSELFKIAKEIDSQSSFWRNKTDNELQSKLGEFREIFCRRRKGYEEVLPNALGAIREAAYRSLGLYPYIVQLVGAIALYRGYVAEMATGEGKTLTSGLTAVLWGWSGMPCHIITVNDYLADRDAKWLAELYKFCGLSVGCVIGEMEHSSRKQGYQQDITYTTCKEIVADFLRDRLCMGSLQNAERRQIRGLLGNQENINKGLVMRGIHNAIVDEVDSILIDEAVTPLIISRAQPNEPFVEACRVADEIASTLEKDIDYRIDYQYKDIELLPGLDERLAGRINNMPELLRGASRRNEFISQALNAKEFFHRDKQYILQKNKVVIVDEFTGRLMPQRTWRAGLHQMVEAKEKLDITPPSETLARLSFQRFYRFFNKLSGMTGTAKEADDELWHIYGLLVISIPQNRPCKRQIYSRLVFNDNESKWQAIVDEIVSIHKQGRPVLIGTRSVKSSENLANRLHSIGLSCNVLNAVKHREEAHIVSQAGKRGAITVATNMAGRGTDIVLEKGVDKLGGLHVITTECHESGRIDRQLFGRSARQGDQGSARSYVSMEDELMHRYISKTMRIGIKTALQKNMRVSSWIADKSVKLAQNKAQRIAFRQRHSVLRMDTWLEDALSFAYEGGIN